jgi:hypothetical protein
MATPAPLCRQNYSPGKTAKLFAVLAHANKFDRFDTQKRIAPHLHFFYLKKV